MHPKPRRLSYVKAVTTGIVFGLLPLCCLPSAQAVQTERDQAPISVGQIKKTIRNLRPLHEKLGKPKPGEWLDSHKEPGQTFSQYASKKPNVLRPQRNKLYIQPIGEFSHKQNEIIEASREYMSLYFQCEAVILDPIDESVIPESAKRIHPQWNVKQWLTSTILEDILTPRLPDDAFASIAMTNTDLWPGDGWNFVFGYASYRKRVGVWSLNRLGDPETNVETYKRCLHRTLKLATHETGHMFSILHCKKYHCNMQGSNHQEEADGQPMALCPECHAKIIFATGCNPTKRYTQLADFCDAHDMTEEVVYFRKAIEAISKKKRKKKE
jgi:archaemetzincin